ncbi:MULTISPECIES: restriction endonuclease subunit S [Ramlibacter]|uniref:Restriction endonuclease subunit S n=1 Tax=Ramlibacter aquaticus TaxID=2780094 RepID=A0ABR9SHK6_9BURK|nr:MULTISPECIES: restriction endonuclease subunit S [Ramlibacter]MBE7941851.1 restriction endonuclease subunit S [Ramlibacter aquaticus]
MKSLFPIVELGKHVHQVSQRNRSEADIEVFSVTNSEGFTRSTDYFSKEVFSKDVSNYKVVNPGQFAYNPSRINVGSIDYLRHDSSVLVSPLYIVFEGARDIHADYLLRFLKSAWGNSQIRANTEGAVRDSLKFKGLESIKLPLPPIDNQIRITHFLGKVEGLIAQRKQHLQQLDDLLKGVFLEMFGDPVRNEKGWDKPELKAFGKISTGNTPPRNDPANYDGDFIEWIKTDNITGDAVFVTPATEHLSEVGAKKARTVTNGALLVACIAGSVESIGRAALTDRTVSFNQQINAIQPGKDVNALYLYGLFKLSRAYIQSHATKGMKKILTKGDFEKITMIKPPVEIQSQFAVIVEKVEAIKSRYQKSLADLEALYGALSQQAFKGELDLSRVPMLGIEPEKEKTVAAEPLQIPGEQSLAIHLPDTDNLLAALESAEARKNLLVQWLEAYRGQLDSTPFSVQHFMAAAQSRFTELHPDNDFELGASDYEHIKAWVFEALASGRLAQAFDDAGNRIELKAAQA